MYRSCEMLKGKQFHSHLPLLHFVIVNQYLLLPDLFFINIAPCMYLYGMYVLVFSEKKLRKVLKTKTIYMNKNNENFYVYVV